MKATGHDVPVILVTGFGNEATVIQALRTGVRDFVTKSVEYLDYLPEAVNRVLRQVQTEHRLAESEARLTAVIDSAQDAVIVAESNRKVSLFNPAAEKMFGCPATEAAGRRITDFIPDELPASPDDPDSLTMSQRLRAGTRGIRTNGETFPLEASVSRGQANGRRFYTIVVRDVTERVRAEEALRRSEQLYRSVVAALADGIVVQDRGGVIQAANASAERILGLPADRLLGRGSLDGGWNAVREDGSPFPGEDHPGMVTLRTGRPCANEVMGVPRPAGELRWLSVSTQPLLDGDLTAPTGVVASFADVTEARRAGEQLRLLGAAVEQETSAVIITTAELDPPGPRILFVNPAFTRMTGYAADEVIGQTPRLLQGPETDRAALDELRARLAAGEEFYGEVVNYRKDGTPYHLGWHVNPIRDARGRVTHFVSVQRDITERKRAEERIREQAALLDLASDAILVLDPDDRILSWNRGAERLYGWAAGEAVGRHVGELHCRGHLAEQEPARLAVAERGEWAGELPHVAKAGQPLTVESRWTLVRDAAGGPKATLVINTDVTERERLGAQLRQAQKMEVIGRLAGGVAHDFNNLLTIINGYSDLLLQSLPPTDPSRELLTEIQQAGERSAGLTRQLLAFSRQQVVSPRVLSLNGVVTDAEKMLRRIIGEDVRVAINLDPNLGSVKADPGQIEQVLLNLTVNARDAMPTGGKLTIETRNVHLDETYTRTHVDARPGPHVLLSVSDTGCGMTPEVQARIFEPFFSTKREKGTGLGLATVYGIVKQFGGHINLYSEGGVGTTFKVYLPRTGGAVEGVEPRSGVRTPPRGTETVLLVEDEDGVRALTRHVLVGCGYTVLEAATGNEAVQLAARHSTPISLLVTDVVMPGLIPNPIDP